MSIAVEKQQNEIGKTQKRYDRNGKRIPKNCRWELRENVETWKRAGLYCPDQECDYIKKEICLSRY